MMAPAGRLSTAPTSERSRPEVGGAGSVRIVLLALIAVAAGAVAGLALGRRPPPLPSPPAPHLPGRPARRVAGAAGRPGPPWLLLAVGVVAATAGRALPGVGGTVVLATGYGLLAASALAARRHPGMLLIAAGLLANLAVVAVDGGMPVRGVAAGDVLAAHHHGLRPGDHLTGLADVVRLPAPAGTVSAGDLLACAGGAVAAFTWLRPAGRGRTSTGRSATGRSRAGRRRAESSRAGRPRRVA